MRTWRGTVVSAGCMLRVTSASPLPLGGDVSIVPETVVSKGPLGMPEAGRAEVDGVLEGGAEAYDAEAEPDSCANRAEEVPARVGPPGPERTGGSEGRDHDQRRRALCSGAAEPPDHAVCPPERQTPGQRAGDTYRAHHEHEHGSGKPCVSEPEPRP